jgi:acyl-CoA thioesterase
LSATSTFDQAIALARTERAAVHHAELDAASWGFGPRIHGGLLMALAGHALSLDLREESGHTDPISLSAYFLSPAQSGKAVVSTQVLRRGRSHTSAMACLEQDGRERMRILATFGNMADQPSADPVRVFTAPPRMPSPEKCVGTEAAPPELLKEAPFLEHLDLRLDPQCVGWALGVPSGQSWMQGWLRFPDDREPDSLMLLLAVDCLPPVSLDLGVLGWAPTLELTAHIRARPAPGWLRLKHSTVLVGGGYMEEDAEIWDSEGRLVAQSRQLARVGRA